MDKVNSLMRFEEIIAEVPESDVGSPIKPFDMTPSPEDLAKETYLGFDFNLELALRPSQTNVQLNPTRNSPRKSPHSRHRGNHNVEDMKGKNYVLKSYASEKNYQNVEQEKLFAGIDPHLEDPAQMDSFLNFLRTNNMLEYSVSGLFDEQGEGSSRHIPKTNRSSKRILLEQLTDNFLGDDYIPEPVAKEERPQHFMEQPVDHIFSRSSGIRIPEQSSVSMPPAGLPAAATENVRQKPESEASQVLKKFNVFRNTNFPQLQNESVANAIQNEIPKRQISYQQTEHPSQPAFGYRLVSQHNEPIGTYSGYMKGDKKHGPGTMLLKDGGKYEGDWNENTMSGIGKLTYPDETVGYEGGFFQNKPFGHGKLINSELDPQFMTKHQLPPTRKPMHSRSQAKHFSGSALIECNSSSSRVKLDESQRSPGKSSSSNVDSLRTNQSHMNDRTSLLSVDYTNLGKLDHAWTHFEGIFVAGSKEGPGKLSFITGEEFVGHFLNDKANGSGYFKTANNETIFGIWQENQLQTILCRK